MYCASMYTEPPTSINVRGVGTVGLLHLPYVMRYVGYICKAKQGTNSTFVCCVYCALLHSV